jgi:hypothetical protein
LKQFCVTTVMGKRLIGKGMAKLPPIQAVLERGTLVIIAGTTNGYVAEEILELMGQAGGFSRVGFRRGLMAAPRNQPVETEFPGDVILVDGKWQVGKTIFDVVDELNTGDIVLKGANAFDPYGQAAVLVGSPQGGTIQAAMSAVYGRRVRIIIPIGLEKRLFEDVVSLSKDLLAPEASGLRLYPVPGEIFTELEAIELLTGAEARMMAAGGIYGAEGSAYIYVSGTEAQEKAAQELIDSICHEPPCEV